MTKAEFIIVVGLTMAVDFAAFLVAAIRLPNIQPLGWLVILGWPTVATALTASGYFLRSKSRRSN